MLYNFTLECFSSEQCYLLSPKKTMIGIWRGSTIEVKGSAEFTNFCLDPLFINLLNMCM